MRFGWLVGRCYEVWVMLGRCYVVWWLLGDCQQVLGDISVFMVGF